MNNILPEFYADIKQISKAIKANKLVVFVGAGVSMNAGVPSWVQLIEQLKKELPENKSENDYLKIAQLYKLSRKPKEYIERVREILKYERTTYNELHKAIFDLNPCHIVTTNYDDLLEQCASSNNLFYYPIIRDRDLPYATVENFIIKMHGDLCEGNIVLSEDEYLNYELNFPLTENYVKSLFSTKLILFVGFSFSDPNLKIITNKVKNILGNHFQPMYLLSTGGVDNLQLKYYEERGVKIVDFSHESIKEVISKKDIDTGSLKDERGKQLYKMLHFISSFDIVTNETSHQPFFEQFISLYDYNFSELNFVGKSELVKLLPNNPDPLYLDSLFPFTLFITNNEARPLLERIKKITETKLHPDSSDMNFWPFFFNIVKKNLVFDIRFPRDENSLNNDFESIDLRNLLDDNKQDSIDDLYELNFDKVKKRIEYLQVIQVNEVSITHLELPFLLYKLGKYYESYLIYKTIANKYWKQKKYVLFFLSMINIKNLKDKIQHRSVIDGILKQKILKEIDNIDLDTLLSRLPINNPKLEKILRGILTYKFVLDTTNEVTKLKEKILESKRLNETPGSFSLNNHDLELYSQIGNLWTFCNSNFVISEHFSENVEAYKNAAAAFLIKNSVKPASGNGLADNAEIYNVFNQFHLLLISIYLEPKELINCFRKYEITKPKYNEKAKEFLQNVIKNGFEIIIKNPVDTFGLERSSYLYIQLQNALILTSTSEINNDEIIEIYSKISKLSYREFHSIIDGLTYYSYKTLGLIDSIPLLETLLTNIFRYGLLPSYRNHETIIINLLNRIYEIDNEYKLSSNLILDELFSIHMLSNTYETQFLFKLLKVLPEARIEFLLNNVTQRLEEKMDYHLFHLAIAYEIGLNPEWEKKFIAESINKFNSRNIKESSSQDEWHLFSLFKMWKKYKDSDDLNDVLELSAKFPFLAFLIDPQNFDYEVNTFQLDWLWYLADDNNETIKQLIKLPKLKNYLKNNLKELERDKELMKVVLDTI
ncbi:SIR2 family protein [Parasediminibacterium sp. JCM 36343]|uniref:SIR2 family protein n=1 Tax=Parasediminibacterium sp. JCM 36343 TaxID=3374279 RepID=UPI00397C03FD